METAGMLSSLIFGQGITNRIAPDLTPTNTGSVSGEEVNHTVIAVDPTGPHHLFVPGGLSLDSHRQQKYNNYIFDIPSPTATGQLYLVTHGCCIGIFSKW